MDPTFLILIALMIGLFWFMTKVGMIGCTLLLIFMALTLT